MNKEEIELLKEGLKELKEEDKFNIFSLKNKQYNIIMLCIMIFY